MKLKMKLIFNSNNSQHLTLTLTFGKHGVLQSPLL